MNIYPLESRFAAVRWWCNNNPARQRSSAQLMRLAPTTTPRADQELLWVLVAKAIARVEQAANELERHVWRLYEFNEPRLGFEVVADRAGCSTSTAKRIVRRLRQQLEQELVDRGLIPPEEEQQQSNSLG